MPLELFSDWPIGEPLPAISIRQPWASAVVLLGKDVENRSHWLYKYRGPILIQASAADFYFDDIEEMLAIARKEGWPEEDLKALYTDQATEVYPQGFIIGAVRLVDVFDVDAKIPDDHSIAGSNWAEEDSPFWLHFADAEPCVPMEYKGRVGLFKVPYEVASNLEKVPLEENNNDQSSPR